MKDAMENMQYTNFSSYVGQQDVNKESAWAWDGARDELGIIFLYAVFAPTIVYVGLMRLLDFIEWKFSHEEQSLHFEASKENRVPRDYKPLFDAAVLKEATTAAASASASTAATIEDEEVWKTRVLFEYIPSRGSSLIMYYDVYREGFAYYCDLQSIPYEILNEIARKYVVLFDCVRFFAGVVESEGDETKNVATAAPASAPRTSYKVNTIAERFSLDGGYATFDRYGGGGGDASKSDSNRAAATAAATAAEEETKKNKFIRMGKVCDFGFLKKPPVEKIEPKRNITYSSYRDLFA